MKLKAVRDQKEVCRGEEEVSSDEEEVWRVDREVWKNVIGVDLDLSGEY